MSAMEDKKAVKRLEDKFRCSLWMDRSLVRHRHRHHDGRTDGRMDGWMDGWIGDDAWMGGGGDVDTLDEWRRGLNEWTSRAQRERERERERERREEKREERRERDPPRRLFPFPLHSH